MDVVSLYRELRALRAPPVQSSFKRALNLREIDDKLWMLRINAFVCFRRNFS